MSIDEIADGREMDLLVHECVMGKELTERERYLSNHLKGGLLTVPHYSADIDAVWEVVVAMRAKGWDFGLDWCQGERIGAMFYRGRDEYGENDAHAASAGTMPLAICRAALKTIGIAKIERCSMSVDDVPAGREMDALVHEAVFGEKVYPDYILSPYSEDLASAWRVVEKLHEQYQVQIFCWPSEVIVSLFKHVGTEYVLESRAVSAPLAICRAALKVMANGSTRHAA